MSPLLARVETTGALEERHEVSPPRRTASRAITPAAARGQTGPGQQQGGEEGWGRSSAGRGRHVGCRQGAEGQLSRTEEGDVPRSRKEKRLSGHPIGQDTTAGTARGEELKLLDRQEGPGQGGQRGWALQSVQPAHRPAAGEGGGAARGMRTAGGGANEGWVSHEGYAGLAPESGIGGEEGAACDLACA